MVYRTQMRQVRFGGLDGRPPRDILILVAMVFVTYSAQFFVPLLSVLRLSGAALNQAMIWQPLTYPFIGLARGGLQGMPTPSVFILLELFILYMFAVDVFRVLGRKRFWSVLLTATMGAALIALVVNLIVRGLSGGAPYTAFSLMQGQRMLVVIVIAAFAVVRANTTILLFFVLPIKARWFVWLEVAFAFIGFLGSKDVAGFVGLCSAIGLTVWLVRHPTLKGGLRELRLRTEHRALQRRLQNMRRKSKLRIVRDDAESKKDNDNPWVN